VVKKKSTKPKKTSEEVVETTDSLKDLGKMMKKAVKVKVSKKKIKDQKPAKVKKELPPEEDRNVVPKLTGHTIHWEEAYPCLKEVYKVRDTNVDFLRFLTTQVSDEAAFEVFLYSAIRSPTLPTFMKNNFKKIRKLVEKEIQYREKSLETLNKEQAEAFKLFFREPRYFEYYINGEYFEHEMERVYMSYLKAYCTTGMYDSRARITNRKSRLLLEAKVKEAVALIDSKNAAIRSAKLAAIQLEKEEAAKTTAPKVPKAPKAPKTPKVPKTIKVPSKLPTKYVMH